ncbi:hypothetical protein EST38_g8556 [Candolleomyces aberdarensis]|uniref:Uncharacterized protein n=1 Tax=Candolleomyces aberdarensis TaxID=2316362 RepID=A0A4V1Q344_9AGAR|nr:hypothetical protein EST38_g8556 [Candolleomyces aberdarensis]
MPGYRVGYAPTSRGFCKGPKPCAGTKVEKGSFRLGSLVEFQGKSSFAAREKARRTHDETGDEGEPSEAKKADAAEENSKSAEKPKRAGPEKAEDEGGEDGTTDEPPKKNAPAKKATPVPEAISAAEDDGAATSSVMDPAQTAAAPLATFSHPKFVLPNLAFNSLALCPLDVCTAW